MIPKIIHYCWFGERSFSKMEQRCIRTWEHLLPEWEIKLWNEQNFPMEQYSFALDAYKHKKYAFVSDVARLHALYTEGGIYMDTDMLLLQSLDELLENAFFTGYYRPGKLAVGLCGCEPAHPLTNLLLKPYNDLEFDPDRLYIITDHFDELLKNMDRKYDRVAFYAPDYFYALPFEKKNSSYKPYLSSRSIAVHLWNHSWKDEFSSLKLFFSRESFVMHVQHLLSFQKKYWNSRYLKKYYHSIFKYSKQFLYKKIYAVKEIL